MTTSEMITGETRVAHTTRAIPRPRSSQENGAAPLPAPRYPWPAPWRYSRAARPRSEFWDVTTASWHSRGPYPQA
jgi:hypothetical protein